MFLEISVEDPSLKCSFNFKILIDESKLPFIPLDITSAVVVDWSYPIPLLMTTASINLPSTIIGLTIAPAPFPVDIIFISGVEL